MPFKGEIFAISSAAAVHTGDLKDPPSPASDFLDTKNMISRSSSSGDHWHFSIDFLTALDLESTAFRPRWILGSASLIGAEPDAPLLEALDELRVCMLTTTMVTAMVTKVSHQSQFRLFGKAKLTMQNFAISRSRTPSKNY